MLGGLASNLRVLRAVFVKDFKQSLRHPGQLILIFLLPFLFTVMIGATGSFVGGSGSASYFEGKTGTPDFFVYQILGACVWILSWMIIDKVGTSLREERIRGTLEQTYLAPINRFLILISSALVNYVTSVLAFVLVIAASTLVFVPGSALALVQAFFILSLGLIPLFGISFVFAGLVIRFKEPYAFVNIVNLLFSILIGTYKPITILPQWVQVASRLLPQTYSIEAMRSILVSNAALVNLYGTYLVLGTMAFVYPLLGYYVFRRFLDKAAVKGDLSRF